jgi:prepilin-type N-terminal cleavage/methylation domain-containing protein
MTMSRIYDRGGFSLIDMMVSISVMAILSAAAVPALMNVSDGMKIGQAQRDVYQEMQSARLTAVSTNRPMRIKFNCPAANQYRLVEVIGSPSKPDVSDSATDRCSDVKWKYPANDNDPTSRPNHDGPIRYLPAKVNFGTTSTLEFWPDGTVHKQTGTENPWSQIPVTSTGQGITVVRGTTVKQIMVNGLGKIQLVP